jgi:calcineurin-like phosphoesterase family protein
MIYFTADWHLGDDRIGINGKPNLLYRPFSSLKAQNDAIIQGLEDSGFKNGDYLFHLGDVMCQQGADERGIMDQLRTKYDQSTFHLIIGNYDEDKLELLQNWFDILEDDYLLHHFDFGDVYLNHYPVQALEGMQAARLGITGHIHGLWKIQKQLINVGIDAWHFRAVSEKEISFCYTAMTKYYDQNVFPY